MIPGIDTYITAEEALGLLRVLLPSTDAARLAYEAMSPDDQTVYLTRSMTALETLRYSGHKTDPAQPLAFPRNGAQAVPENMRRVQVLEACALCHIGAEAAKRASLQAQGVKSFSAGSMSESYDTAGKQNALLSPDAARMLKPFLLGAARFG